MAREEWNADKNDMVEGRNPDDPESPSFLSLMFMDQLVDKLGKENIDKLADSNDWEVNIDVNGFKMDPISVNKFLNIIWEAQHGSIIIDEAKRMFQQKWDETFGGIEEFTQKAQAMLEDKLREDWEDI